MNSSRKREDGSPLLCRLGFHKWRNCGDQIEVFWQEPTPLEANVKNPNIGTSVRENVLDTHNKVVYEGKECKRCGTKLRRKLVTNSDGTLSSIGWEPDNEERGAR
jgi:hypothetical protein